MIVSMKYFNKLLHACPETVEDHLPIFKHIYCVLTRKQDIEYLLCQAPGDYRTCTVPFRNKRPKIYAKYAYAYAYIRVCVYVYTHMRMRICAYTLCARMLISMYKLAGLFFLLLIVDCSFNDPTLRHLKVHGRMNKSCHAKESLHVYFYRKY